MKTERLLLKRLAANDGKKLLDFYTKNQEFLAPYEPSKLPSFFTLTYQETVIKAEKLKEEQGRSIKFLIYLKTDPKTLIGMITLNEIVKGVFQSCYMGYKMDHDYLNRGYMTEAVEAVVSYAFDTMGLHRIEANIMPRNKASIQVVTKAGFNSEGLSPKYLRINGVWEDHVHMVKRNLAMES